MINYKSTSIWAIKIGDKWRAFWRPFRKDRPLSAAHYTKKLFPTRKDAYDGAKEAIDHFQS